MYRALDGISLALRRGVSLAIIGDNGAGNSTLLKTVAEVIQPTRSTVRVGALLDLGSGFRPEYTGPANFDLAEALLGAASAEIATKRERIIAFEDIGEHIDEPIKHYSCCVITFKALYALLCPICEER